MRNADVAELFDMVRRGHGGRDLRANEKWGGEKFVARRASRLKVGSNLLGKEAKI